MAKPYYLLIFVLAVAIAYSQSQTSGSAASAQSTPSNTAGSIYGNTTSANPQTPAQSNPPTSQPLPGTAQGTPDGAGTQAPTKPGSATDASGGGVAGSAGSGSAAPVAAETPSPVAAPAIADSDLQSQIQNALAKEPTLSGESVRVTVAEDNIEMNGSVATAREKLTASRIVQSYAGNKKVVSHLTVGGHSGANTASPNEPNKGAAAAGSSQPPR